MKTTAKGLSYVNGKSIYQTQTTRESAYVDIFTWSCVIGNGVHPSDKSCHEATAAMHTWDYINIGTCEMMRSPCINAASTLGEVSNSCSLYNDDSDISYNAVLMISSGTTIQGSL